MTKAILLTLMVPSMSAAFLISSAAAEGESSWGLLLFDVFAILFLVALNGFFVSAEFGIIGVRPTQLEEM